MDPHHSFWSREVMELPLQDPLIVPQSESIEEVIKKMQGNKTGCALVEDFSHRLIGIFTERDVMRKFVGTSVSPEARISEIMVESPIKLQKRQRVCEAVSIFGDVHLRHLPVVEDDLRPIGLLSIRTLMDFLAQNLPQAVLNLPPDTSWDKNLVEGG